MQGIGGGSFMVTIPKKWAVEGGVTADSVLLMIPNEDGTLTIYPPTRYDIVLKEGV